MIQSKRISTVYFFLSGFEAILAILWLGLIPSESGNAVLFGYSTERLLLISGMGLLAIFSIAMFFLTNKIPSISLNFEKYFRRRWIFFVCVGLFLISWISIFLPTISWGRFAGYKNNLLPVICWLFLVSFQSLVLEILLYKKSLVSWREIFLTTPGLLRSWGGISTVVAFGFLIIASFRIGLVPDIVYWNDINVPILGLQVIGVTIGGIFLITILFNLGFFSPGIGKQKQRIWALHDVILCILIWGLAVVVWTQVKMPHSYFAPGPFPPNGEMYPFSDAAGYDSAAQFAAIGEGLGTKTYVDKPMYVAFLTIIHLLVGSRMQAVTGLQVAIIALLPVVIFLLGKKIHSHLSGVLAAGFVIFREVNNIQGTLWILSTNSRLLMSESLVTLLLALFVLFLAAWIHSRDKIGYLLASGGFLGLAALVRLNPFLLLPATLIVIILVCWKQWKRTVINSLLFILMFFTSIFPWSLESWMDHGNILFFQSTYSGVVLDQRTFYSLNQEAPASAENGVPANLETPQQPENRTWKRITGISRYVSAHFFHNMISAVAILPTSLQLDSLENTIKAPNSFWSADWKGDLSPLQIILLLMNLALLSLGVASSWTRWKWAGLVPAGFLVAYSLATSVVRTSGGRYILPADWVVLFYFALGIAQLYFWSSHWLGTRIKVTSIYADEQASKGFYSFRTLAGMVLVFIILGGLPVILDRVIPPRYTKIQKTTLIKDLSEQGLLPSLGISQDNLETFLEMPDAVVYNGRGLYPRFYPMNQGEPDRFSAMRGQPFPRLVMTIIGPKARASGVLPMQKSPEFLPNGADVLAIGCKGKLNDDWLALVVFLPEIRIYLRNPATEWTCPVRLPVCDDNRNCR